MAKLEAAHELDALVEAAQESPAPTLSALSARRLVRSALLAAEHKAARERSRARYAWLCAAAALLLAAGGYAHSSLRAGTEVAVAAHGRPLRLSLKSGDTLVIAPASQLEVLSEKPSLRRVRLKRGSALFDVARPVARGAAHFDSQAQRFVVETPHAEVRVRGTVFTVHVSDERSVVRVYEGSVRVGQRVLSAGDSWASDQKIPALEKSPERALHGDVRAVLAARRPVRQEERERPPAEALAAKVEPLAQQPASRAPSPTSPADKRASVASASNDLDQLRELRELFRRGQTEQVITLARAHSGQGDAFVLLLADALRAQGRFPEAVDTYEMVAERALGPTRSQAGFAAAQIALLAQRDAGRALRAIERFELDGEGYALNERASVLHVDALRALGRGAEARQIAARYLARQPATEASQRMRHILEDASVP